MGHNRKHPGMGWRHGWDTGEDTDPGAGLRWSWEPNKRPRDWEENKDRKGGNEARQCGKITASRNSLLFNKVTISVQYQKCWKHSICNIDISLDLFRGSLICHLLWKPLSSELGMWVSPIRLKWMGEGERFMQCTHTMQAFKALCRRTFLIWAELICGVEFKALYKADISNEILVFMSNL